MPVASTVRRAAVAARASGLGARAAVRQDGTRVAAAVASTGSARRGVIGSTVSSLRPWRATMRLSSASASIWSTITRRIWAALSAVSCGSSRMPLRSSVRVASSSCCISRHLLEALTTSAKRCGRLLNIGWASPVALLVDRAHRLSGALVLVLVGGADRLEILGDRARALGRRIRRPCGRSRGCGRRRSRASGRAGSRSASGVARDRRPCSRCAVSESSTDRAGSRTARAAGRARPPWRRACWTSVSSDSRRSSSAPSVRRLLRSISATASASERPWVSNWAASWPRSVSVCARRPCWNAADVLLDLRCWRCRSSARRRSWRRRNRRRG